MIDVVITNYNKPSIVNLALMCASMNDVDRIIIVDDKSTDNSLIELEKYNIPNIEIVKNDVNLGPSASKLKGVAYCTAPFVCVLDADDTIPMNFFHVPLVTDIIIPQYSINGTIKSIPKFRTAQQYLNHSSGFNFIGAIIKREMFNGIEPNDMRCFEDLPTMVQILLKNPSISYNTHPYQYNPSVDSEWAQCPHNDRVEHFKNIWAICHNLVKDKGYPNSFIYGQNIVFA